MCLYSSHIQTVMKGKRFTSLYDINRTCYINCNRKCSNRLPLIKKFLFVKCTINQFMPGFSILKIFSTLNLHTLKKKGSQDRPESKRLSIIQILKDLRICAGFYVITLDINLNTKKSTATVFFWVQSLRSNMKIHKALHFLYASV